MDFKPTPFVEGWEFVQTLGEGAYGEVKLAVCSATMECVAVKIINVVDSSVEEQVKKEICIHKMLEHKNIIKFYGYRKAEQVHYLFLKYASGGELFDRIEPDVGMKAPEALRHFHHLIEGVEYLHSRGVCHRDLKPENLLLDENDMLQITDFGMATVFRYQGQERELSRMCGTKPYTAPEVFKGVPYKAEPADVWSCGIILVALLAGELPWDIPTHRDKLFRAWKERCISTSPWNKVDTLALSLFRSVLVENPSRRYTLAQIKKHQFYNKTFPLREAEEENGAQNACSPTSVSKQQRQQTIMDDFGRLSSPPNGVSASQPDRFGSGDNSLSPLSEVRHPFSFSQPVQPDDLLLNSQIKCTPGSTQTPFQKLVKRMTRFFVHTPKQETAKQMEKLLRSQGYGVKKNSNAELTISTVDKSKSRLIFKVYFLEMAGNILVEFRMSKGDGLEFKRHFVRIKNKLQHIVRKTAPTWPLAADGDNTLVEKPGDSSKHTTDNSGESHSAMESNTNPAEHSVDMNTASEGLSTSSASKSKTVAKLSDATGLSSPMSKVSVKTGPSKRTLEDCQDVESSLQKRMKQKETGRPSAEAKKEKVPAGSTKKDVSDKLDKAGKPNVSTVQRKIDDSLAGVRQQVNGERDRLKEYVKTARDSYYGLHRSTTM